MGRTAGHHGGERHSPETRPVPSVTLAGRPESVSVSRRLCSPAGPQPRPLGPCLSACMLGRGVLLGHSVDVQSPGRPEKKTTPPLPGPFGVCEVTIVAWPGPSSPCVVSVETDSKLAPPSF